MTTVISALAILLHIVGVCLLTQERRSTSPQRNLLLSLSYCDIGFCILSLLRIAIGDVSNTPAYNHILILSYSLNFPFFFGMFFLTLDRFLQIFLHLGYLNSFYERHKERFCLCSWFTAVLYGITVCVLHASSIYTIDSIQIKWSFISLIFSAVVVTEFIMVYTYIFIKLRKSSSSRQHFRLLKDMRPFLIILTFVLFIFIPVLYSRHEPGIGDYLKLIYRINFLSDALIHILLQPRIKRRFVRLLGRKSEITNAWLEHGKVPKIKDNLNKTKKTYNA